MVESMTCALVAAMAPARRVRGARPSRLHDGAVVSRVPALPTPLIARADRWPGTDRSREQLLDALTSIEPRHDAKERARRQLAVRLLLDWLAEFDGDSWQQRWMASGADAAGRSWSGLVQFRGINKEYPHHANDRRSGEVNLAGRGPAQLLLAVYLLRRHLV
jgi:hypothetical protein